MKEEKVKEKKIQVKKEKELKGVKLTKGELDRMMNCKSGGDLPFNTRCSCTWK